MPPNPLRYYVERKTSRMLTRVGWEPAQTWPVPRPGRSSLLFETRLPAAGFVAADDLPASDRDVPASVGRDTITLAQAAGVEGVFLAAAICSTSETHGVLATMTAALTPKPLPFIDRDGAEAGRKRRRAIKNVYGKVRVIEREADELTVQYAVRTRHGTLTLTFIPCDDETAGNAGRRLFQNIVRGVRLGRRPLNPGR